MNNEVGDDGWWRDVYKILKCFKQYFGTNHSNYETREREKERGEQIFSELAIDG
jgi:hypothetical protein